MLRFLVVAILLVAYIEAQEVAESNDDKTQCIKKFIEWCDGMNYPKEGTGMTILSLAYHDETGYNRIFCSSDSEGSNCTRNGSPWFTCTPDHILSYKGQVLSDADESDIDDEICGTVHKVYNELSLPNFSISNVTLTKINEEMGSFFEEMLAMQQQIRELQRRLSSLPFFDTDDFFGGGFGAGIFPRRPPISDEDSDESEENENNPTKDSNQIEKE